MQTSHPPWWNQTISNMNPIDMNLLKRNKDGRCWPNAYQYVTTQLPNLTQRKRRRRIIISEPKRRKLSEPLVRTLKTRIYPSEEQKQLLKKWIGISRHIYNKSIDLINKNWEEEKFKPPKERNYIKEHDTITLLNHKDSNHVKSNPWVVESPRGQRTNSVRDAFKARRSNFALIKGRNNKKFHLHFRKKKYGGYITIEKQAIQQGGIFYMRSLGQIKIPSNNKKVQEILQKYHGQKKKNFEHLPLDMICDCKISLDAIGNYWLQIPYKCFPKIQREVPRRKYVALDPGVRTFQAFYCPDDKSFGEIGKNDIQRIYRLNKHLDDLQSRMSEATGKKKKRMKKAWLRLIERIKNLVNEVHKKTARYLTKNYQIIILPKFETGEMVNNVARNRNIGSKTARALLTWSHYRFQTYLKSICEKTNTDLKLVTEEYTSKTCGRCGNLKNDLGANKVYCCDSCGFRFDRDLNAARNIFIKYMNQVNLDLGLQGLL